MKWYIPFIICFVFLSANLSMAKQNNIDYELLSKIYAKADSTIQTISRLEYDMIYYRFDPIEVDTNILSGKCLLKFYATPPLGIWHKIVYDSKSTKTGWLYSSEIKYDGKFVYSTRMDSIQGQTIKPLKKVNKDANKVFGGSFSGMFIPDYFRNKSSLTKSLKEEDITNAAVEEVSYNGNSCYKIALDVKDATLGDLQEVYYFRKSDYLPIGYFCWFTLGALPYYYGYDINYIQINQEIADSVFVINPIEVKPTQQPEPDLNRYNKLVKEGTIAPDFSTELNNGEPIQLSQFKGKIVVMDFWYVSCPPCLKAIPELVAIDEQYPDEEVMIVGVNPYNEAKHINGLFEQRGVKYVSTVKSTEVSELYGVTSYPTTIIIDQQGEIYKVFEGFNEELFKKQLVNAIEVLRK